ncbi:hypothetical protein [Rhodoferax sp.]|uniref:hypothetical protein n=1 Tax=Rhodoferax sp. TaxID=50421 RepID=UPI002614A768|nr:hypothetical protein [Rhodoferax sp.]MDD2918180.1 hypothetical protein [Rhodoferax sp.]
MFVILGMTGQAFLAQLDLVQVAGVADGAGRGAVFAAQGVLGVNIMVEAGGLPRFDAMTGFAFVAKLAFVPLAAVISFFVTANTRAWCILVIARLVTRIALDVGMFAQQRKTRGAVIKLGFFPVVLAMAISAFDTQRALVFVVFGMACVALSCRLTVLLARHMALGTFQRLVLAIEHKVGLCMVELLFVKVRNLRIPALVVRMASVAGLGFEPAVKTGLRLHVGPHVFVAVSA